MFRFPYATQHYILHRGWDYAAKKAIEFTTQPVSRIEVEWWLNYCKKLPFRWQEDYKR